MPATNEPAISENGVFFDTLSQKIVHEQPAEGIQLVRPGGPLDAAAQREIALYGDGAAPETVTEKKAPAKTTKGAE